MLSVSIKLLIFSKLYDQRLNPHRCRLHPIIPQLSPHRRPQNKIQSFHKIVWIACQPGPASRPVVSSDFGHPSGPYSLSLPLSPSFFNRHNNPHPTHPVLRSRRDFPFQAAGQVLTTGSETRGRKSGCRGEAELRPTSKFSPTSIGQSRETRIQFRSTS